MPYPISPDFFRVETFFKGSDKVWSNIYFYTTAAPFPGNFDLNSLATAFETQNLLAMLACLAPTCKYEGLNLLVHNAGLARSVDKYASLAGTDSPASDPLPDDMSVVVSKLSTTAGKSGRGRLYFGGIPNRFVTENRLNTTGTSTFGLLTDQLKGAITNQTMLWSPAIYSKKNTHFYPATTWYAEPLLGTTRHRKARR